MKIAYLGAGAAGRYCGACLHDNTLATALTRQGVEILLIPTYTPIRTDEENVSHSRVFFGGLNVYLQQKSALFRHTPWFIDAMFDSPRLLNWLSKRSSGMQARSLGSLPFPRSKGSTAAKRRRSKSSFSGSRATYSLRSFIFPTPCSPAPRERSASGFACQSFAAWPVKTFLSKDLRSRTTARRSG